MLFHRVSVAELCVFLLCFCSSAHFAHGGNGTSTQQLPLSTGAIDSSISAASLQTFVINATSVSEQNISKTAIDFSTSAVVHTVMPAHTTEKQSSKDTGRKFDGLSFFGGMILGAFICILLLFSVKYYQAKKRSYHSL